jgi:hypothetical protein
MHPILVSVSITKKNSFYNKKMKKYLEVSTKKNNSMDPSKCVLPGGGLLVGLLYQHFVGF